MIPAIKILILIVVQCSEILKKKAFFRYVINVPSNLNSKYTSEYFLKPFENCCQLEKCAC